MKALKVAVIAVLFALSAAVTASCKEQGRPDTPPKKPMGPIKIGKIFTGGDLAAKFGGYFEPVKVDIDPKVPPYSLPLAGDKIQNFNDVQAKTRLGDAAWAMLMQNGFVSAPYGRQEDIVEFYKNLEEAGLPIFITSDSVLHLYHIQFDETLREIEEREFYPDLTALTAALQQEMNNLYNSSKGIEKDAFKKGLAYFTVALKLLKPDTPVPPEVAGWVEWELKKIDEHAGFPPFDEAVKNAIFAYPEDYSQYVPRGHYTRSEELKRYFKAMMWYGRLTMLIKGNDQFGPEANQPALVSVDEAKRQTILGAYIAALLGSIKVGDRKAADIWQRIYVVTAYYVGLADDLTPDDYLDALGETVGDALAPGVLATDDAMLRFQSLIAAMRQPAIYSGTGSSGVNLDMELGRVMTHEQLDRILGKTQGFRFMGQRYIPDSYILGQLVAPSVGQKASPAGFTAATIPDVGIIRAFPRGLDVMAVLGSDRAVEIMDGLKDTDYADYAKRLGELREQFGKISDADWNRNLYWSWLYALKGLIEPVSGEGMPTFMTTKAWADKQLNAALGSWSSLRHDTILYAKQSYTPTITAESAEPFREIKPVVGYVEPVPEFYARLVALNRITLKGLDEMKVLDDSSRGRIVALENILVRLQKLAEMELKNEQLTEDDYAFIRNFGANLNAVVSGASEAGQKTTLVADVHTDQNTSSVLEEGTGYIRLLLVAYKLPQGHILIGAGPALSYYEFKHPMRDRLTDEKWRTILTGADAPALPEWTQTFSAN